MKYVYVTFSSENYIKTRERSIEEVRAKNIFSQIFSFGTDDIYSEFLKFHKGLIDSNPSLFGYYIWKPYVIFKVLNQLQDGDILVYGDAGNTMPGTREECLSKFNLVKSIKRGTKILACKEGWNLRWIKTDLYFRVKWYSIIYAFAHMPAANRIVIQKDYKTLEFVENWLDICTKDYRNVDYSPSKLPDMPFFIQHRCDQSVLGLLFHLYTCKKVDFENVWLASRLRF